MCGIAGVIDKSGGVRGERVRGMLEVMQHRGPDSLEVRCWDGVGLGHVRLSIVALGDAGLQPMRDASGRYWIVFNGEVYNYIELRKELVLLGHTFNTQTDTEAVLNAYKQWGPKCLDKFNGMWGMAIYDQYEGTCFLARDRFGIKPLHFANIGETFLFSSEIKGLIAGGVEAVQDDARVGQFFVRDTTDDGGHTLFKNIHSVGEGCYVMLKSGKFEQVKWWETNEHLIDVPKRFEDRVAMFDELLLDATRLRLRNDVGTALTLSGGMDSSTLFGMTRRLQREHKMVGASDGKDKDLDIFSVTQPGQPSDESEYVRMCLNEFGGKTHWIKSDPNQFSDRVDEIVWAQEAPVWSNAVFGFHEVYRKIAEAGFRVVIEGHGSDEMLAGYPYLVEAGMKGFIQQKQYGKAYSAAKALSSTQNPGIENQRIPGWLCMMMGFDKTRDFANTLKYYRRRLMGRGEPAIYMNGNDYLKPLIDSAQECGVGVDLSGMSHLKQVMYDAYHHRIMPTSLRVLDRASMASSLEIRVPYMDWRVVRFAFSLPDTDIVSKGESKHILREMAKPYVPKGVIKRKAKMGFSVDAPYWFKNAGVKSYLNDVFKSQDFKEQGWIDSGKFIDGFDRCMGDRFGWIDASKVWKVLNVYLWRKQFLCGQVVKGQLLRSA